jgi:predicted TIM-barrel fold metal-dependent hydrolase
MMDRLGINKAMLSLAPPGVWLGDRAEARRLSRACNRYAASLTRKHPGRFGVLAGLPFPNVDDACDELAYALDSLHLDGVMLLSNVAGQYVGDPEHDALMKELDDRGALVLLHPSVVPLADENAPLYEWAEYPIDVARAYTRLVYNDTLVRFPRIRWILAHAGGVVPFLADRIGRAHYANGRKLRWGRIIKDMTAGRNGGLELAKNLSYDTAGAADPVVFAALRHLVEPTRLCFGSNFPWESEEVIEESLRFRLNSSW